MWFDGARHDLFLEGLEEEMDRVADDAIALAEHDQTAAVEALWHDVKRCVDELVAALAAAEALRHARLPFNAPDLDEDAGRTLAQLGAVVAAFRRRYEAFERRLDEEALTEEASLRDRLVRESQAAAHEVAAAGTLLHLDSMAEPAWNQLMDASRDLLARLVLIDAQGVELDPEALAVALARRSEKMLFDARALWAASHDGATAAA